MKSQTETKVVDSITQFGRTRLAGLSERAARLKNQAQHVSMCKDTHRRHQMRWRGMDPAKQLHAAGERLPKTAWVGAVGGFLLDAIQVHIDLNQDIHVLRKEVALLRAETSLIRQLLARDQESQAAITALEEAVSSSSLNLDDQDIPEMREEALRMLCALLQENATGIVDEQRDLRRALLGLIDKNVEIAVTEAGYHVVPNVRGMNDCALASKAGELVRDAQALMPTPESGRGMPAAEHATVAVNLDRAIALALLAFPDIAEKHARHAHDSTIPGRMKILHACVVALTPKEQAAEGEPVDYRGKHDFASADRQVSERLGQFAMDLQRSEKDLQLCVDSIAKAQELKLQLSKIRTF